MTLSVEGLTVRVGDCLLVDDVSFEAEPGEIVAVIGPNGAGKTSLLEAVVGLRAATGRVRLSNKRLASFTERARAFAFSPDDVTPPPETLVSTLVEHARRHRPRADDVLSRLLASLQLEPLLGRSPGGLSRGERKRIALYLALAADRPVVVLDEPLGTFDPLQLRDVLDLLRSMARAGAVVLVSVHQLADAERVADRVLLLANGRRIAFGTVAALREQVGSTEGSLEAVFIALLEGRQDAT